MFYSNVFLDWINLESFLAIIFLALINNKITSNTDYFLILRKSDYLVDDNVISFWVMSISSEENLFWAQIILQGI